LIRRETLSTPYRHTEACEACEAEKRSEGRM
jgi:hypothetical protein